MPNEQGDDLEQALQALEGTDTGTPSGDDPTSADPGANVPTELLKPSSQGGVPSNGKTAPKPEDFQKRYQSLRPQYDKAQSKLQALEKVITDPRIAELAKTNPDIREALAKAGYEHAKEQEERAAESEKPMTLEDLAMELAVERETRILDQGLSQLSRSLGRELTREETLEILNIKQHVGGLSVEQAWKLTPSFEKNLKANQEKQMNDWKQKNAPARPKPHAPLIAGQAPNLKKPVTEFNDAEKNEYIANLLNRTQTR